MSDMQIVTTGIPELQWLLDYIKELETRHQQLVERFSDFEYDRWCNLLDRVSALESNKAEEHHSHHDLERSIRATEYHTHHAYADSRHTHDRWDLR